MTEATQPLQYLIAEKGPVQVVSLVGSLNRESEKVLDQCLKDILSRPAAWVILNLREVSPEVERTIFRNLVQMQKNIRDKGKEVRVTGIHPNLLALLDEQGIIRRDETHRNVAEALKSLQEG